MQTASFLTRAGGAFLPTAVSPSALFSPAVAAAFVGFLLSSVELLLEDELLGEELLVEEGDGVVLVLLGASVLGAGALLEELAGLELVELTLTESPLPPQAARPRGSASRVAVAAARVVVDMA